MDLSTVNNAVNDAIAGLPAGTSATQNSNILSGVVLAGDSWLANNALNTPYIQGQLGNTPVTNIAVGGSTSGDALNQLNNFIKGGGTFAPGTTFVLDAGGNDLLQGISRDQITQNLNQISKTLGDQGVNIVLSAAPNVNSVGNVTGSTNLGVDPLYQKVADQNPNVTIVDAMSGLLNQKNLVDESGFHMTNAGQMGYDTTLSNAVLGLQGKSPVAFTNNDISQFVKDNNLTAAQAIALAPSFGLTGNQVTQALSATSQGTPEMNNPSQSTAQFVGTPAPGAVGTSYGQASNAQIASVQQSAPQLATALQNGTAAMTYDGEGVPYLYNTQTGQQLEGNYQIQVGQNGQLGINMPSGNGSMVQIATQQNQNGSLAPVTASNVLNVGVNQGAGGFAGGPGGILSIAEPALAIVAPELIPYIASYNAANAVNKGQTGAALVNAAIAYVGFNPDSPLVQAVQNGLNVNPDAPVSNPTSLTPASSTGTELSNVGQTPVDYSLSSTGTELSNVGQTPVDYSLSGTAPIANTVAPTVSTAGEIPVDYSLTSGLPTNNVSTGTGLNVGLGQGTSATSPLFNTSLLNPSTGLANGLGLQPSGTPNIAAMGGGQGLTTATTVGGGTTPNAVLGATGATPLGTGGLPTNPLTGQTLGTALNNITTGINVPLTTDFGVNANYTLGNPAPASAGTGLNVVQGTGVPSATNPLFNTTAVNPATGLTNGLGLQPSGSTNLANMGGGQGLTAAANTGASGTPTAVVGAAGVTPYGTGGLPVNPLTGQTLGTALSNVNTGITTPSSLITNSSGNVVGTPAGAGIAGGVGAGTAGALGAGTSALDAGMGVYPSTGTIGKGVTTNALGLTSLQTAIAGTGLAGAIGTIGTNNAISNAANTQATAAQKSNDYLSGFYDPYAKAQQPYQNLGASAVQNITNQSPYLTHQFNAADLQAGLAPNYDFMLAQGQGANRNAANVGGGLLSGNTLQGLNQFTQNYAGNAYQNAFNNYQTQRQNIYGNLASQAGLGQTSLGQIGQVGSNLAQTYGNITTGLAASQAGAQTAQAVNNANLLSNLAKTGTVLALA